MNQYELRDRQELSAQHHVRWLKAFYTSLIIGGIFLMLPRAVPWFSSGVPETAMGRIIGAISSFQLTLFVMTAVLHMVLAVCYGLVLAMVIYRFEIRIALLLGTVIGLALYGLNFVLFRTILGTQPMNEAPVICTHLFFSLIFSAAYKGISVPDANRVSSA
jgi:hypothetical protein